MIALRDGGPGLAVVTLGWLRAHGRMAAAAADAGPDPEASREKRGRRGRGRATARDWTADAPPPLSGIERPSAASPSEA